MVSRKIIIPVAVATITSGMLFGTGLVFAQSTNNSPLNGLVQMIAQKFNLDQNQVQSVVDQYKTQQRSNRQQKMQQMEDLRLGNLVAQGKITNDQKTAIENELASLREKYLNNTNLSVDQRKQNIQNYQNDLKAWAASQKIDMTFLRPRYGMGPRGFGHKLSPSMSPNPSPTSST